MRAYKSFFSVVTDFSVLLFSRFSHSNMVTPSSRVTTRVQCNSNSIQYVFGLSSVSSSATPNSSVDELLTLFMGSSSIEQSIYAINTLCNIVGGEEIGSQVLIGIIDAFVELLTNPNCK